MRSRQGGSGAAIAAGFLLASLGIAVLPARTAARARTSQLLRAE